MVEAELTPLLFPTGLNVAGAHEPYGAQFRRLASLQDRRGDIGREEAQLEDSGEIGWTDSDPGGEFYKGAAVLREYQVLKIPCLTDETQEAAVRLSRGRGSSLDDHLG